MLTDEELKRDNQRDVDDFNSRKYPSKNGIDCPFCHNKGFVSRLIDGEPWYISCICTRDHEVIKNANRSGLGEYLRLSMPDFKTEFRFQSIMKQKALKFLESPERYWFVALGKNGTGKTTLIAIIANSLLKDGRQVLYKTWPELVHDCDVDYYKDKNTLKQWQTAEVLFIDDFLKGSLSDRALQYAYELLNYRYNHKLITLISSEKLITEIQQIDKALGSRIMEMTGKNQEFLINNRPDNSQNQRL